jgi:hypothetical protein
VELSSSRLRTFAEFTIATSISSNTTTDPGGLESAVPFCQRFVQVFLQRLTYIAVIHPFSMASVNLLLTSAPVYSL